MRVKTYHVESKNFDLIITPGEGRKWIGISGHNIPSFELFLSPDWRGTEGTFYANLPAFRSGNYVEGVRLKFKKGTAVKISAKTGKDFVVKQLSMDKGANKVGEFSLTDKRFSKINKFMANTLFDEKIGGTIHLALGNGYPESGSTNVSSLHWDMMCDLRKHGDVFADDEHIFSNGNFLI